MGNILLTPHIMPLKTGYGTNKIVDEKKSTTDKQPKIMSWNWFGLQLDIETSKLFCSVSKPQTSAFIGNWSLRDCNLF